MPNVLQVQHINLYMTTHVNNAPIANTNALSQHCHSSVLYSYILHVYLPKYGVTKAFL